MIRSHPLCQVPITKYFDKSCVKFRCDPIDKLPIRHCGGGILFMILS